MFEDLGLAQHLAGMVQQQAEQVELLGGQPDRGAGPLHLAGLPGQHQVAEDADGVLDGMLPDLDGIQVLRRLRHENPELPVLMLTARDAVQHRLDGLRNGADDYVTKPFSLEEVVLRLRGLLRRAGTTEGIRTDESVRVLGDLVLAPETREVHRAGEPIHLTAKEFDLLGLLLDHPRQILSRTQILDHVWSPSFDGGGNLVEVYVSGLRRKIDRGRAPMIHTVRGMGYAIRPTGDGR